MHIFFKNPGNKIKTIALIPFVICCVVAIICGVACMSRGGWFVVLGFAIMPPIAFFFYIPILFLYAVGEMVDKMTKAEENTREIRKALVSKNGYYEESKPQTAAVYKSSMDETIIDYVLAQEEDRVEMITAGNPMVAGRIATLQEMCLKGVITKQQYFEELRKIQ